MKYVSAFLMCVLGGNDSPSTDDVKKVLSSVGIEADEELLTKFMSTMEGKNATECVLAGQKALESMKCGGGGAAAGGAGGAAEEEKKEEEEEEEEAVEVGNMFGGDDDGW
eukprot:g1313.t1